MGQYITSDSYAERSRGSQRYWSR